jgi:Mg2+-importing ATPase
MAVSVIPEALPLVLTFSLSRGALRFAKNDVIVKRLSAVQDLGSVILLCTD